MSSVDDDDAIFSHFSGYRPTVKRQNLSTGRVTVAVVFRPCYWKCITGVKN